MSQFEAILNWHSLFPGVSALLVKLTKIYNHPNNIKIFNPLGVEKIEQWLKCSLATQTPGPEFRYSAPK